MNRKLAAVVDVGAACSQDLELDFVGVPVLANRLGVELGSAIVAKLGIRALIAGSLANLMSAALAGLFLPA